MARGPFQGSWQPNLRPTVVTAPDAIVYINGDTDLVGCPNCNRSFDLNKYITSITVDLSVESVPGSASIQLAIPRHSIDDFYFDGNPVVTSMMEVEIYAKGYYLLEGIPQYYPIFWGLTTEVTDAYSGGAHTVAINCSDILKFFELTKMNVNPAYTSPAPASGGMSLFGNTFSGMNPYDIIFTLANQAFGDVVVGTGSLVSLYKEAFQKPTFTTALSDIMLYWQSRFARIRNGLLLYGTNGVAVRGDTLYATYQKEPKTKTGAPPTHFVSSAVQRANGGPDQGQMTFDPTSPGVVAFRSNLSNLGVNMWQSEFQTKLELANSAKEAIGFEFFMDVDGSIVFKPPFYNLDVISNKPTSWIQDIDVINWDFSESEAEVVTQIIMQGSYAGAIDIGMPQELSPFTSVTDYHLLRKYGWRSQTYNSEFLANQQLMFYHGLDLLDRLNARRHRGTVNIPMRPELRLGFPIYIAPKDQIWYVMGISHNIAFGSQATTTLTLTAKRTKFIGLRGTGTLSCAIDPVPTVANNPGLSANGPGNSQSAGNPVPSTAFPYSSNQLSAGGQFTLNLGSNPAYLPAVNSNTSATDPSNNPYQPIILQDPTSGRILGYPNVVMVYARPFADATTTAANQDTTRGQTALGTSSANQKTTLPKISSVQVKTNIDLTTGQLDTIASQLRGKHVTNRYLYGLSSAGRFVYACDKGISNNTNGIIGEILTIPYPARITVKPTSQDVLDTKSSQTVLIRPISDERGFEVVGHYKYGRRVSLRDGSLVLTGNTNNPVNIDTQLALGGDLYTTLTAQSQGITAISSAYPNPASVVTLMAPSDLNTAGVVQPDNTLRPPNQSGNQFIGPQGYNALGSPQQAGAPVSVEATQLSKALTLAEMTIQPQGLDQGDPTETSCPCLYMRSDLAFLNTGYSLAGGAQITGTATSDFSTLGNSVPGVPITATLGSVSNPSPLQQTLTAQTQLIQNLQTQLDSVQSRASSIDAVTNPVGWAAAQQTITNLQIQIQQAQDTQTTIETQIQTNSMQGGAGGSLPSPSPGSVQSLAETFLTNLYKALDTPHQQLEHVLRGDYLPGGPLSQPAGDLAQGSTSASPLAPPFSPATASAIGNPAAAALTGDSAVNDLVQTWNNFGQQLQASAQRAQLQGAIQSNTAQLKTIQSQISTLQQEASTNGSTIVIAPGTPNVSITPTLGVKSTAGSTVIASPGGQTIAQAMASLQNQATQLQQQISDAQLKLSQLPAPITGGNTPTLTPVTT